MNMMKVMKQEVFFFGSEEGCKQETAKASVSLLAPPPPQHLLKHRETLAEVSAPCWRSCCCLHSHTDVMWA